MISLIFVDCLSSLPKSCAMRLFRIWLLLVMKLKIMSLNLSLFYILFIVVYSTSVLAKDEFNTLPGNVFKLSLNTEVGQIDNFLYASQDEEKTAYLALFPTIEIQTQFDRQLFSFDFKSQHRKYQDFSRDDHTNFTLAPSYQYKLAENKALFVNASLANLHEMRGTGLSLGNATSLSKGDELEIFDFSVGYLFGNKESVAKVKIELGQFDSKYQTRREETYLLDQQKSFADISFDYLLSGQSYFATNVSFDNISFKHNKLLDKKKYTGLAGVKWQTTEISQLALLVGYQQIKFANSAFKDDDGFKWRFDWNWHPIYSTKVSLSTERDFEEANRLSNSYRVVDSYNIKIKSNLTDYFIATAVIGSKREKIIYQQANEKEIYLFSQFQVNYQRSESLSFYIKYDYKDLDSSEIIFNNQRNSISIGFDVTI